MTGLERNSEVVQMAAYAPLFVHANFVKWPTNLIVIDNHRLRAARAGVCMCNFCDLPSCVLDETMSASVPNSTHHCCRKVTSPALGQLQARRCPRL